MTPHHALAAAAAILAACATGGPARPSPEGPDDGALGAFEAEIRAMADEARTLSGRNPAAACPRICGLAEAICLVTDKICAIAVRHPDRPDMAGKCDAARRTCAASRKDCADTCPR